MKKFNLSPGFITLTTPVPEIDFGSQHYIVKNKPAAPWPTFLWMKSKKIAIIQTLKDTAGDKSEAAESST